MSFELAPKVPWLIKIPQSAQETQQINPVPYFTILIPILVLGGQIPAIPALELDGMNTKQLPNGSDAESPPESN